MENDYRSKKTTAIFTTIVSLLPFVQNAYQLFVPSIDNIVLVWKILIVAFHAFLSIANRRKTDRLLLAVILCNVYMIIPTFLNDGYYIKFFGYFIDSVGLIFVIRRLAYRYQDELLSGVKIFCRIMIYINFILLIIFPQGVYVINNGYITTRYLFLGLDNQAAILLITFMIIIYAIERRQCNKLRFMFWLDFFAFFVSTVLIWCGTEIVGILVFVLAMIYQKVTKRVVSINHCIYILFGLFAFVILFHGFSLFSGFIVSFLGKDMTLSGRTLIWSNGIQEWLKYPLLGHGYQDTEALITFGNIQGYVRGAHNQVLSFLLHGGVVFVLLYVILFKTAHKAVYLLKKNNFTNLLTLGILTNFVMWTADTYGHLVGMYLLIGLLYYERKYINYGDN